MPQLVIANIKIHVEVPLLLLFFAFLLAESVGTNFIIYRTCYLILGFNKSECALLGTKYANNNTAALEQAVQPTAMYIKMITSVSGACMSAILCVFVGPWSDRFGRRPILLIPVIGFTLSFALMGIFAFFDNISPWFMLVCAVPILATGGGCSYFTVLLSYITDVTTEKNRGLRMGFFDAVLTLGMFLGNLSSSYILEATNYPTVFLIASGCCLMAFVFTVFFIPESLTNRETEGRFRGLFQLTNVRQMIAASFKPRSSYDRFIILSFLLIFTFLTVIGNGEGSVMFLFLREKFQWSLQHYTIYGAVINISGILGTLIGIYILHNLLKIPETIMLLIGFGSSVIGMMIMGFAVYNWEIYTSAAVRALSGVSGAMIRSLLSKIVPPDEVAKVFALMIICESLFGMGGSSVYTFIYNSTISVNSAIFNFVSAGIYIFFILPTVVIIFIRNKSSTEAVYTEIIDDESIEHHSHTADDETT